MSQDKINNQDSVTNINVSDLDDVNWMDKNIDKYFVSKHYIQLESDTNMLFGEIDKIVLRDNRIYILDQWNTYSIFIFDENGRFINKVDHKGEGPEEYIDMRDMFYDDYENTINILTYGGSGNRYKIMSYDRDGNKLVKQQPIDLKIAQVERAKDGRYVFHSKHSSNRPNITSSLFVYSRTMQRLYSGLPINFDWIDKMSSSSKSIYKDTDDNIYCSSDNITDIYQITEDSLRKCYHYDFGKYNFPKELNTPDIVEKMGRSHQLNNYVLEIKDFYKRKNFIISTILFKGQYRLVFYDKTSNSVNSYLMPNFKCFSNNYMITTSSTDTYIHLFKNPSIIGEERTNKLKQYFKYPLREDDNPILEIYEFK